MKKLLNGDAFLQLLRVLSFPVGKDDRSAAVEMVIERIQDSAARHSMNRRSFFRKVRLTEHAPWWWALDFSSPSRVGISACHAQKTSPENRAAPAKNSDQSLESSRLSPVRGFDVKVLALSTSSAKKVRLGDTDRAEARNKMIPRSPGLM
jgi:hypothetical protein